MDDNKPNWLLNSRAYKKAKGLVDATLNKPQKLLDLVTEAQLKTTKKLSDKFSPIFESVNAAVRLLKAYAAGEYRDISLESIALIVASIIYFVMPIDAIPDFILALGYTDDAALLAWTFRSVSADIERFLLWEAANSDDQSQTNIKNLE